MSCTLFVFSFAVVLALCGMAGSLILNMRENAWSEVSRSSANLLRSIERSLDRDVELYDLSLQAVVDGLQNPDLEGVSPRLRQLALFDRAATAAGYGSIFVLDQYGQAYIDSHYTTPRSFNAASREYFQIHKDNPDVGLYIGQTIVAAVSGKVVIPLSRRVAYADGSFAGVVVGAIEVAHFSQLFERLNIEPGTAINLFHANGTLLVRSPIGSLTPGREMAGEPGIARLLQEEAGQLTARLAMDGVERTYTFMRVGRWPLRLSVANTVQSIQAAWRPKAVGIGLIVLVMCLGIGVLTLWLHGELRRRLEAEKEALDANAELARLAITDSLTELPNRRRFDQALDEAHRASATMPTALLLFDTDQFKRYNDIYGHPAGDQALKAIARVLRTEALEAGHLACRIGGEEFAVIAHGIGEADALAYAERLRAAVASRGIPHAGLPNGVMTISIGVMHTARHAHATTGQWLAAADAALYEAKREGRNQVRAAGMDPSQGATRVA